MKEGRNPHEADSWWQESAFLAWYDEARGIGGIHRLGTEINRGTANMWCGIFKKGGASFRLNQQDLPYVDMGDGGFGCGPQRLAIDGSGLHWSLDTPEAAVNVTISDYASDNLWHGGGGKTLELSERAHYHSICSVVGTVRLGNETIEVNGVGWRDHSYGVRHWDKVMHHRCVCGSFARDHALDFMSWLGIDGTLVHGGFEIRGGVKTPIEQFDLTVPIDEDGISARSADVKGTLPSGQPFVAHFDAAGAVLVETHAYLGIEAVGIVTLSTGERGFGYMAVSNNARLGRGFPPLVLHALWENGLKRS